MSDVFCVGCGGPINSSACGSCGTPSAGAAFEEQVFVGFMAQPVLPSVCSCCLRSAEVRCSVTVESSSVALGNRYERQSMTVGFPSCRPCRKRRGLPLVAAAVVLSLGAVVALGMYLSTRERAQAIYPALAGVVIAVVTALVSDRITPDRPGHVRGCEAVRRADLAMGGSVMLGANVVFANRACAKKWRELNGG